MRVHNTQAIINIINNTVSNRLCNAIPKILHIIVMIKVSMQNTAAL